MDIFCHFDFCHNKKIGFRDHIVWCGDTAVHSGNAMHGFSDRLLFWRVLAVIGNLSSQEPCWCPEFINPKQAFNSGRFHSILQALLAAQK